jgi:hypothetical protein
MEGDTQPKPEFTAAYRLGVDIAEGSGWEILLGGRIFPEWS